MENKYFEPQPQDIALDAFRKAFPLPSSKVVVSADGWEMTYRMRGSMAMERFLETARLIIIMHELPLKVERDRFAIGDMVLEDNMVVSFEPSMIELYCY